MKDTQKVAFIDWNDTVANFNDKMRQALLIEVLQEAADHLAPLIIDHIRSDFAALLKRADDYYFAHYNVKPRTKTTIIDYAYRDAPPEQRQGLIDAAIKAYNLKKAERLALNDGVIEQLTALRAQGYALTIVSNKDTARMRADYEVVRQSNSEFSALIPWENVFVTDNPAFKKPCDYLFVAALSALAGKNEIVLNRSIHLLFIADSPKNDMEAVMMLQRAQPAYYYFQFALLDPKQAPENDQAIEQMQDQGIKAFRITKWAELSEHITALQPDLSHVHQATNWVRRMSDEGADASLQQGSTTPTH
jgi:FMN phosphatase YigB (HAD superfamily)